MTLRRVLSSLVVLLIVSDLGSPARILAANDHTVSKLSQNAWMTRAGSSNRVSVNVGDVLKSGDRFETLRGNTAQLVIGGDVRNQVRVEEDTVFTLVETDLRTELKLERGSVLASMKKLGEKKVFKVTTPTTVAAIRGTQFQVVLAGDLTEVRDHAGSVEVSRLLPDGSAAPNGIVLKPGEKARVRGVEGPVKAEEMSASELGRLEALINSSGLGESAPTKQPEAASTTQDPRPDEKREGLEVDSYLVTQDS